MSLDVEKTNKEFAGKFPALNGMTPGRKAYAQALRMPESPKLTTVEPTTAEMKTPTASLSAGLLAFARSLRSPQ